MLAVVTSLPVTVTIQFLTYFHSLHFILIFRPSLKWYIPFYKHGLLTFSLFWLIFECSSRCQPTVPVYPSFSSPLSGPLLFLSVLWFKWPLCRKKKCTLLEFLVIMCCTNTVTVISLVPSEVAPSHQYWQPTNNDLGNFY